MDPLAIVVPKSMIFSKMKPKGTVPRLIKAGSSVFCTLPCSDKERFPLSQNINFPLILPQLINITV